MTHFPLKLFTAIMREAPAQPATNLWRAVELKALVQHALPKIKHSPTLLDLGCGDGGIMAVLRPYLLPSGHVDGLDADPAETELARQKKLYARVYTAEADKIPLAGSSVDAVISNSVLEHVESIEKVLSECGRALRSGGWFVATVPGPDFHHCLRGALLPWVNREAYEHALDERLAHLRYWTREEWGARLAEAGLVLVETHDYLPLKIVRRWEFLSRMTGGLLYAIAGKKKAPLQLQRALRMRRQWKLPYWLMWIVASVLSWGLNDPPPHRPPRREESLLYGGLLVMGRKP
jgi:SAM-dependent methyltransferase